MNAQREARDAVTSTLDSASINYYVQSCLELVTNKAIEEIALQGGTLYKHQIEGTEREANEPGKTHVIANIIYDNTESIKTNVSYGIRKNNSCSIIHPNEPNYPKPETELRSLYKAYKDPSNFLCVSNATSLQDHSGFFGLNS